MSRYYQFRESISHIMEELQKIQDETSRLFALYRDASETIDLTFVKKIEEHYAELLTDVSNYISEANEQFAQLNLLLEQEAPIQQPYKYA